MGAQGGFGWTASMGGSCIVGGAQTTAGSVTTGCKGSLESIQDCTGLCVAKMATVSGPRQTYSIDVTEVTQGQYSEWLATNPQLPPTTDETCGALTGYLQYGYRYTGSAPDHYPVVNVDWCSAYAYCLGVGKRLCGAIDGGSVSGEGYHDATISQWYRACSSGGVNSYPYGNTYEQDFCSGADAPTSWIPVGSLSNCVTSESGFAGVYDLSGSVSEWENSCFFMGDLTFCNARGGSFQDSEWVLACDAVTTSSTDYPRDDLGFRCCSA